MLRNLAAALFACVLVVSTLQGAENGLTKGTPDLQQAGALAFGPDGVLFIGDARSAAVFAVDTGDAAGDPSKASIAVDKLDSQIAGMLGTTAREVQINDAVVNPASGNVYVSVSRGRGPDAQPALFRVDGSGKVSEVSLKDVPFARASLPNAPSPGGEGRSDKRSQSITDIEFADGQVFVAGLSNEEFESTLRSIPFPFSDTDRGAGVKIYHGAHGKFETQSPVRTFTIYDIGGDAHVLAGYQCTPLVKFPVSSLKPGSKIDATTIAELGNRNRPLDMFVYEKNGKDYILLANNARGVMKITTDDIGAVQAITDPVRGGGTAGLSYETIEELKGVEQLDRLNENSAVVLVRNEASGEASLKTIALP
jgi:hypothetical protein